MRLDDRSCFTSASTGTHEFRTMPDGAASSTSDVASGHSAIGMGTQDARRNSGPTVSLKRCGGTSLCVSWRQSDNGVQRTRSFPVPSEMFSSHCRRFARLRVLAGAVPARRPPCGVIFLLEKCVCPEHARGHVRQAWLQLTGLPAPAIYRRNARGMAALGRRSTRVVRDICRSVQAVAVPPTTAVRGTLAGAGPSAHATSARTGIRGDRSLPARRCAVDSCTVADTLPTPRWAGQAIRPDASAWRP